MMTAAVVDKGSCSWVVVGSRAGLPRGVVEQKLCDECCLRAGHGTLWNDIVW